MKSTPDFFRIQDHFSDEEKMTRDAVADFVTAELMPIINECYSSGRFPVELIPKIAGMGLLGATFTDYGCPGFNYMAYGLLMQELERGDSGLRSFVSVQNGLVMYPIHTFGSDEQREKWLPSMAQGKAIGCFGLTEADFGSNPEGMLTTAARDGDDYVINGSKMWITNGNICDVAVVFAKLDGGIQGFLVEMDNPGFTANEIDNKLSLRASVTSELVFTDCRIPGSNILPGAKGLKTALMCLNQARFSIATGVVGAAMACFEEALEYAKTRVQFGRPIGNYQIVQAKLVEMWNEICKAQMMSYRLGRLFEEGKMHHITVSAAKRNNVRMALQIAREARDMLGASGILDEYSVMRHMCNLEAVSTYEGTHDIHTLIIGRELTGMSAFTIDGG